MRMNRSRGPVIERFSGEAKRKVSSIPELLASFTLRAATCILTTSVGDKDGEGCCTLTVEKTSDETIANACAERQNMTASIEAAP
jgi:hypothetical protein